MMIDVNEDLNITTRVGIIINIYEFQHLKEIGQKVVKLDLGL